MVVLELLHLKIEVTVSEPCDVIRVLYCIDVTDYVLYLLDKFL